MNDTNHRYYWTPSGSNTFTPLGQPFSGFIQFSTPQGRIADQGGLNQLTFVEFTGAAPQVQQAGPAPIPQLTYFKSDIEFNNNLPINIVWDENRIISFGWGPNPFRVQRAQTPGYSLISDMRVQSFFSPPYFPDESAQEGSWIRFRK